MEYTSIPEEEIEEFEYFIQCCKPWVVKFPISKRDLTCGRELYNNVKTETGPKYKTFGRTGYDSYAIYKSRNQRIYIFVIDCQELYAHISIDDVSFFDKIFDVICDV